LVAVSFAKAVEAVNGNWLEKSPEAVRNKLFCRNFRRDDMAVQI
jgi:hypothetical protein